MRHRESTTGCLAMAGPMVLFVGIFAVCCGILTCIFFRGAEDAEYLLSTAAEPRQGCVCWTLTVSTPEGEALYSLEIFMEEARR